MNTNLEKIDTTAQAPVTEPERQYYFMARAREHVKIVRAHV